MLTLLDRCTALTLASRHFELKKALQTSSHLGPGLWTAEVFEHWPAASDKAVYRLSFDEQPGGTSLADAHAVANCLEPASMLIGQEVQQQVEAKPRRVPGAS